MADHEQDQPDQPPQPHLPDKPLYLLQGSPLVAGGKARLLSGKKVKPRQAQPKDVTGPEEKGYTTEPHKAMEKLECPSPAWVDAQGELATIHNQLRLEKQVQEARVTRQALTCEQRMADAHRRAKLKHIDLTGEFYVMRKMLARDKRAEAVTRMERVEARLDGVPLDEAA